MIILQLQFKTPKSYHQLTFFAQGCPCKTYLLRCEPWFHFAGKGLERGADSPIIIFNILSAMHGLSLGTCETQMTLISVTTQQGKRRCGVIASEMTHLFISRHSWRILFSWNHEFHHSSGNLLIKPFDSFQQFHYWFTRVLKISNFLKNKIIDRDISMKLHRVCYS